MRYLAICLVSVLVLTSCDSDPASPDPTTSKGTITGNVIMYDKTLTRMSDASGAVVTYVDVNNNTYTATTQSDGVWKMELPYGVYRFVSITKNGYTYLHHGSGKQYSITGHLDWLGMGERQVVFNTRLMPEVLDTTSQILSVDMNIDTTYKPGTDDGHGHYSPATYHVAYDIDVAMKYGAAQHRLEATIFDRNGVQIGTPMVDLRGTFDTTLVISTKGSDYIENFDLLQGATVEIKIISNLNVYTLIGDASGATDNVHETRALHGRRMVLPITY